MPSIPRKFKQNIQFLMIIHIIIIIMNIIGLLQKSATPQNVIPAKAGIYLFCHFLDAGLRRHDNVSTFTTGLISDYSTS
jgi:hypothetical protein